jgi:hypothetical protein
MRALPMLIPILAFGLSIFGPPRKDVPDDTDWWSLIPPQGELIGAAMDDKPPLANFTIVGIDLGPGSFDDVVPKLGIATVVMRGETQMSREQLCYRSADASTRLIFEHGERGEAFYIVGPGKDWSGSGFCKSSPLVTDAIATQSGLRLGLTPPEVAKILGNRSGVSPGRQVWLWSGQFPVTDAELSRIRQRNPHLAISDASAKAMQHDLKAVIEVRYTNNRASEIGAWYHFDDLGRFDK